MKYSALQKKFVVNEQNGEMIGFITDLDLNSHSLCIESIILKEPKNLLQKLRCLFFNDVKIVIAIDNIISIGKDVIVVKVR